jgi:hypothetical protein
MGILSKWEGEKSETEMHKCIDCGKTFYITRGEANFFKRHGLNLPKRCENCRIIKKATRKY